MAGRVSPRLRGAGVILALGGGSMLLGHAGSTAPAGRRPARPLRPAARPAPPSPVPEKNPLVKPSSAPPAAAAARAGAPPPVTPDLPPPGNEIMPVAEVRAGMKARGYTVFRGTAIERFDVDILGVMPKAYMGQPLVLVRLSGGPISARGAYLIQGMSGSPIYIGNRLLGAFSMGNSWPKEPIGMVTPIESMLEALDPKLSQVPAGQTALDFNQPGSVVTSTVRGDLFQAPSQLPTVLAGGQSFKPLGLPVSISGLSGRNLDRVAQALQPFNMDVMQGPGGMTEPFKAGLTPGAALGVALMTGDVDMTAIGTITYRKDDQILAFGHPMMQIGAAQFPITTAWIHDVFPGFQVSHKIGSAGDLVGTLTQDRPFSIAAQVGPLPAMIPIRCSVSDQATGRSKVFNIKTANHPMLVGQLLPVAVDQGLFNVRPVPGDAVAHVKLSVETEGAGTITRENVFFDPVQIDVTSVRELQELMGILANNSFRRVPVKSLDVDVTFEDRRPTATVERVFLAQDKYEPGDTVNVGVVLRPYRKDPVVVKTKVKIPENAANGRAVLMVQGGGTRVSLASMMQGGSSPASLLAAPPPDASLKQVLKRFSTRERNNQLVARVIFPTTAVNVNGERLSQLPSALVDVMRSSKSTGLRVERDEARALSDVDYIVEGVQTLEVTIEKKDQLEKPRQGGARPSGVSSPGPGVASSPRGIAAPAEDVDDFESLSYTVNGQPRVLRLTPEDEETDVVIDGKKQEEKKETGKGRASRGKNGSRTGGEPKSAPAAAAGVDTSVPVPATGTGTTPEEKLVGRQAILWTQTAQADFERGSLNNAAVSTNGEVRLSPGLHLAHESSEQFVWSVLGMNGAVYAGTGNGGLVLKTDKDDQAGVFFRTGELAVHALAKDKAGNLYVGTSPNGKIFRVTPDGKGTEILSMNGEESAADAGGKFVLSLATAEDGTVYAGTGPTGKVYRIQPGATRAEELCTLPAKSIMSLLLGPDGTLYAGTADGGAIYRIRTRENPGFGGIVYDTDDTAVTGLALDRAGNLYAAGAPSGQIYRIDPQGLPRVQFEKGRGALYGLLADSSGALYSCNGSSVLRIEQDGTATLLMDRKNGQFTCLAWDEQGHMVAGSANVGSVYRLTPATSGSFESTVHDARLLARWGRMRYTGMVPAGGTMTVETRSGNTPEPDATWSPWQAPVAKDSGQFVASPEARFLQYRVLFQAQSGGTPALRDMAIAYLPRNQAPKLTLTAPAGGETWKGAQTLKWTATDPDSDALTYELSYSSDGGRTWKPLGEKSGSSAAEAAPAQSSRSNADEALARYKKQLDEDASLSPQQREESYQKARGLVEKFLKENPDPPAAPAPAAPVAPASPAAPSGVTRATTFSWDTKQVPDGLYVLRVTATDRASNPSEPLSDSKVSEPVIVCNSAPQVFVFERGINVDASKKASIVGFAAGRVSLKGAQYRLGTGDWTAIDAEDGLWDSAFEHFRFTVVAPGSGEQTLELKVGDGAGNVQTQKVKFSVP